MKQLIYFIILTCSVQVSGQSNYSGFIDKYPIEFVLNLNSIGNSNAIYVYTAYDEPINLVGNLEQEKLTFFEKDKKGNNSASLTFQKFNLDSGQIHGVWKDLTTAKELKITLTKNDSINDGIIQGVSIDDKYFRIITDYLNVSEIKIFQKKTDKLIQKFEVECRFWGLNNISIGDYNFDGILDFSVFESSYAGPNTSSLYFLYNPKTNRYFESGFSGISLKFDKKRKRIIETNQCCAGASITTAEYKVVKNEMILVKERCFKWSETKQELVEQKVIECR